MINKTIGLLGAIGYDDMGDDALLLANLEALKSREYNIIIFTNSVSRTTNLLITHGFLPENSLSNKIKIVESFDYLDQKIAYRYTDVVLNSIFKNSYDVFQTINHNRTLKEITKKINTEDKLNPHFLEYLTSIKECSLILFIGGGYMNKYWGHKIYQFIASLSIAHEVGIPCIASGQTFGPFDDIQKKIVKKHIKKLDYILIRDINRSKRRLLELGFDENKIIEGPDDAIFLSKNVNYINRYDSSFVVTVNFGLFLKYSKHPLEYIHTIFAQFFDYLVDSKNAIILNISMTTSGKDVGQGLSIQSKMKHKDKFYFVPLYTDLKTIKAIISTSDLVVSSRLHPIVFSISEKRPYIGISSGGEYYDSKLMGISEIYNYKPENHVIKADDLSLDKLKNLLLSTLNEDYRLNNIYESNETKRNNFLEKVDSYF